MSGKEIGLAARILALALLAGSWPACRHPAPGEPARPKGNAGAPVSLPADALVPSPRLIVGRVLSVDAANGYAFVDLAPDAPADAVTEGIELIARTPELRETGRLRTSRYLRGRTLGTKIVSGQPSLGDEVVWLAP